MPDALQRIRPYAKTLGEAPFRVLFELCARAPDAPYWTSCSSRDLAEATGLSRSNVVGALDTLEARGLIQTTPGTATKPSAYKLAVLELPVLLGGGPIKGPPVLAQWSFLETTPGPTVGPPLDLLQDQGGPTVGPPPNQESTTCEDRSKEHARAPGSIDIDSNYVALIDRLAKSTPSKYDAEQIVIARNCLHGYMAKYGHERHPHPPDDTFVARFLGIAEWPRLEALIYELMAEHPPKCGDSYGWFETVAMQRIRGVSYQIQRKIRADLRAVKKPRPAPAEQQPLLTEDPVQQVEELKRSLRAAAAGKGKR